MWGWLFLVGCLGCIGSGMKHWRRYQRAQRVSSPDPASLPEVIMWFLGAAANLVAAAVAFFH
jgi:hypothetical protein